MPFSEPEEVDILNDEWERVRVRVPATASKSFGRLEVEQVTP
jgi:hypothetical protein